MKRITLLRTLIIFSILSQITFNSIAQEGKAEDKYLIIVGAEFRYTQVTNSKSSSQEVIDNINLVIEKFNPDNIIYVYTVHKALWLSFKGPKVVLDSIGMIRDERLNIVNDNIIKKKNVDAFKDKNLIQILEQNNVKDVVIIGFMADYYVKESLTGGQKLGYKMYFIPEAIMGKSEKNNEKIFSRLAKKGIIKLPINEL